MAAGLGFKTFTTGEVLSAADVNGYLMQGVLVFASAAARNAAITSPQEGQFAFTKDTNGLWYYDGAAWVASGATGDIEGVTAGVGISGGGTSGTVTITNAMATEIAAKGDLIAGTGSQTFDNLTVGANNTVLTADSTTATGLKWAAAASSSTSWSLLNSGGTALTGAQTVTVSGISGKDKIMVLLDLASSASANSLIGIRLNTDTGNNYFNYAVNSAATATYEAPDNWRTFTGSTSSIRMGVTSANAASGVTGGVTLSGCNSSGVKAFIASGCGSPNASNTQEAYWSQGYYNSATVISSISVFSTTGNFDGGTVFVYTSAA